MQTEYYKIEKENIYSAESEQIFKRAGEIIRNGGLVAFPTETVYGLGADALNSDAVLKIFEAKGRPADNPLIVHIADPDDAVKFVYTDDIYSRLKEKFMPGPLTVIMPRRRCIPDSVTAGLDSAGMRCPSNIIARRLIEFSGVPIAAPSANSSGKPSPTSAEHVLNDMNGKIDMIIDGGKCDVGVESTVVKITDNGILILRPGAVTADMLKTVCDDVQIAHAVTEELGADEKPQSPGMKYKHYAPSCPLVLVDGESDKVTEFLRKKQETENCVILCFDEEIPLLDKNKILPMGKRADSGEQIKRIFARLREADTLGKDIIYAHLPKKDGLELALYNRMIRAAAHQVIHI